MAVPLSRQAFGAIQLYPLLSRSLPSLDRYFLDKTRSF